MKTPEDGARVLATDEITTELRHLAATVTARLVGVATVGRERAEDTGLVEGADVCPSQQGAVGVWWMHSADDIIVGVGRAPGWELPRTAASVELVRNILDEAVAGRVEVGKGRGVTAYRLRTRDGVVREDTHEGLVGVLRSMPWKPRLRWESAVPYSMSTATD